MAVGMTSTDCTDSCSPFEALLTYLVSGRPMPSKGRRPYSTAVMTGQALIEPAVQGDSCQKQASPCGGATGM